MEQDVTRSTSWLANASRGKQWLLIGSSIVVLSALLSAAYWTLRPHYEVLFSGMHAGDASAAVAELEKQKIPYRLDGDGDSTSILVPGEDVRATRIKLMSGDLKLKNVVGMELFNNSDLGLTDFAQKVNYQRALQGELARTIMSLDQVDMARVHLTLPESSIFRNDQDHPKASVALFLRDDQALGVDMVRGIQRLVAAAVPQMRPSDVTVVDERGAPLTAKDVDIDDPKLAIKQSVERYYQGKVLAQLAPLLHDNHAYVSVNADIDFDQVSLTRESNTNDPAQANASSTATLPPMPTDAKPGRNVSLPPLPPGGIAAASQLKTQHTVEQIVSAPGSVKRLSVSVVLDQPIDAEASQQVQALVAATVGMDKTRGDAFSIAVRVPPTRVASTASPAKDETAITSEEAAFHKIEDIPAKTPSMKSAINPDWVLVAALLAGGLGIGLLLRLVWPRRVAPARLSDAERKALAQRLQSLLNEPERAHVQR